MPAAIPSRANHGCSDRRRSGGRISASAPWVCSPKSARNSMPSRAAAARYSLRYVARQTPLERRVVPDPGVCLSITTVRRPRPARWNAALAPWMPAPMMPTSKRSMFCASLRSSRGTTPLAHPRQGRPTPGSAAGPTRPARPPRGGFTLAASSRVDIGALPRLRKISAISSCGVTRSRSDPRPRSRERLGPRTSACVPRLPRQSVGPSQEFIGLVLGQALVEPGRHEQGVPTVPGPVPGGRVDVVVHPGQRSALGVLVAPVADGGQPAPARPARGQEPDERPVTPYPQPRSDDGGRVALPRGGPHALEGLIEALQALLHPEGCTYSDRGPDQGFPSGPIRLVRNPETVPMMADRSLLRSGAETWRPVSPDMFMKQVSRPVDNLDPSSWPPRPRRSSELEERPGHGPDRRHLCPTVSSEGATDDLDPGRPLRTRAGPRPRRDGPRPQGEGPPARAIGRGQGALGAVRPRPRLRRALPPGGARGGASEPSEHRRCVRQRLARRHPLHRDRARRGRDPRRRPRPRARAAAGARSRDRDGGEPRARCRARAGRGPSRCEARERDAGA